MAEKLLEGVKIADFTWNLAAPIATRVFSNYGAEVVKIEGKRKPDGRRVNGPYKDGKPGFNRSGGFNPFNTSKLSLAINLTHPKGMEVAKKVVR